MNKEKLNNPSQMILGQVINTLKSLDPSLKVAGNPDEIFTVLYSHLKTLYLSLGQPSLKLRKMERSPISDDINQMLIEIFSDLNVIFDDYRSIGKYVNMGFDFSISEHLRLKDLIKQTANLLADYRMYSKTETAVDFVVGDTFTDSSKVDSSTTADVLTDEGVVVLKRGASVDRINNSFIKIADQSNGLMGNYPESYIDGLTEQKYETQPKVYKEQTPPPIKFFSEINPHDNLLEIADGNPDTVFEYHKIVPVDNNLSGIGRKLQGSPSFSQSNILSITKGLGFTANIIMQEIKEIQKEIIPSNLKVLKVKVGGLTPLKGNIGKIFQQEVSKEIIKKIPVRIDSEPSNGILILNLLITLEDIFDINWISILPYVPHFVQGYSYNIKDVSTSLDGINFISIAGKTQNLFRSGQNETSQGYRKSTSIGDSSGDQNKFNAAAGVFTFASRTTKYVLIEIEQDQYYPTKYGHIYYNKHTTVTTTTTTKKSGGWFSHGSTNTDVNTQNFEERVEGPAPDFNQVESGNIRKKGGFERALGSTIGGALAGVFGGKRTTTTTVQTESKVTPGIEDFPAARWLIGIRDIAVQSFTYEQESVFVSNNIKIPQPIERLALIVSESIPEELLETGLHWIEYYFSCDGGTSWARISPQNFGVVLDSDGKQIPELFLINSKIPEEERNPVHGYVDINNPTQIKFKALLKRTDNQFLTPVLRDFRFKIITQKDTEL